MTQFTNAFSEEVWASTYKHHEDKTIDDTFRRVARAVSSVEKTSELQAYWEEQFSDMLADFKVVPGGRILANAGTEFKGTTLINCYVAPKPSYDIDSLDGILKVLRDQAQTLKSEGGWGNNFSFIRPRGSFIHGIGVETPGAVKYMELFDKSSEIVTAGSGLKSSNKKAKGKIRKGAQMAVLDCTHPDIEEFITAKQTPGRLTKFNMSVNCFSGFMDKVVRVKKLKDQGKEIPEELNKWELIFPDTQFEKYKAEWDGNIKLWLAKEYPVKVYKTTTVEYLWELISKSTYNRNEPGVLFLDTANKTHAWNYAGSRSHISATNPCGEQTLPDAGCCLLLSLNLTQFIDEITGKFDFDKMERYIKIAIRFADNINDYSATPLPEYKESLLKRRRIGLGVMGWGSTLFMLGLRFGSKEAEAFKKKMMRIFTHTATKTSIELAIEKGMFEDCDPEKHAKAMIWDMIDLDEGSRALIRKYGIRNSALFSFQPTGNTAVVANIVSGGGEPAFYFDFIRTAIVSVCPDHIKNVCPKYWEGELKETEMFKWVKEGDDKILRGVDENGVVYKIDANRGLTKEVLCEDYGYAYLKKHGRWNAKADWACTAMDLSVEDHITDMMGWYQWLDSAMSKTVNLPNDYPYEDFQDIYLKIYSTGLAKGLTTYRAGTMANVLAVKEENKEESEIKDQEQKITKTTAPKRKKSMECNVHLTTLKGDPFYVVVGMLNEDPYEIFTGSNKGKDGGLFIPKKIEKGFVTKKTKGVYELTSPEHEDFKGVLTNGHSDDTADALTRMISTSLRHGADILFIVSQLEKTQGDLASYSKILARVLKKYIPDGTKTTDKCPECGHDLIRVQGCIECPSCSYSKCS